MIHSLTRLGATAAALPLAAQTSTFAQPTPGQASPAASAKEPPFLLRFPRITSLRTSLMTVAFIPSQIRRAKVNDPFAAG
jgi:hypothetical protein